MSVLDEIVARKRADVAKRMEAVPYADLRERAVPTARRLERALKKPGPRFILECKKASPSEGLIRKNFDAAEIADAYKNFADAVSVLTDEPYFQGSFEILRSIRERLTQPVLAKDFVVGPYQVCEARAHGADAVLLMLSVLDDSTYGACAEEAARLSMDVLTETHDEAELERALKLNARIVGINNRNLKTLKVDLDVFRKLVGKIPDDRIIVCESGIGAHQDVSNLEDAGANPVCGANKETEGRARSLPRRNLAYLVGGMLMKSGRLDLAVRRLIYGGVKVCGLSSPEDAIKCYEAGAIFGGLIFADESPRRADAARAREVRFASPLPMAGVFVNDSVPKIARLAQTLELSAVQLHGEESAAFVEELRKEVPESCEIWKAVRVEDNVPLSGLNAVHADRVLLDTFVKDARGGTGKSFDWRSLERAGGDEFDRSRIILAGGIDADNARRASKLGCFAIDVNSGVEILGSPGKKDRRKIENLFARLRGEV